MAVMTVCCGPRELGGLPVVGPDVDAQPAGVVGRNEQLGEPAGRALLGGGHQVDQPLQRGLST